MNRFIIAPIVAALLLIALATGCDSQDPEGPSYFVLNEPATHWGASSACESVGAHLAVVDSLEELQLTRRACIESTVADACWIAGETQPVDEQGNRFASAVSAVHGEETEIGIFYVRGRAFIDARFDVVCEVD